MPSEFLAHTAKPFSDQRIAAIESQRGGVSLLQRLRQEWNRLGPEGADGLLRFFARVRLRALQIFDPGAERPAFVPRFAGDGEPPNRQNQNEQRGREKIFFTSRHLMTAQLQPMV